MAPHKETIVMMKMKSQMKLCGDGCRAQRMRVAPLKEAIVMMKMQSQMKHCGDVCTAQWMRVAPQKETIVMMKMKMKMKRPGDVCTAHRIRTTKFSCYTSQEMPQYTIFNVVALVHDEHAFPSSDSG